MATAAAFEQPSRRRISRYRLQSPVDVTVLRSGIPDTLPGRSVDLSEAGVGALLAGELLPGESVGVEIQLPRIGDPLRARALVRHHEKLRHGMEFVGLSLDQHATIRSWAAGDAEAEPPEPHSVKPSLNTTDMISQRPAKSDPDAPLPFSKKRRPLWRFVLLLAALAIAGVWWHWRRSWQGLEFGLPENEQAVVQPEAHVPADVMQKLLSHRVDPEYPESARAEKIEGIVILDVVIGRDGTVVGERATGGPDVLANAALEALRWWRFEPYRVNGKPMIVETTVAMEFKP